MKLRNKKTGEIIDIYKGEITLHYNQGRKTIHFKRLEDLEEWEDYEEPKEYWCIDWTEDGGIFKTKDEESRWDDFNKQIGNHFNSREEAEKAVEKLKAWKRLKDKGFRFTDGLVYGEYYGCGSIRFIIFPSKKEKYVKDDLDLLFGGEE